MIDRFVALPEEISIHGGQTIGYGTMGYRWFTFKIK
mgnify:CR=1 FL=1